MRNRLILVAIGSSMLLASPPLRAEDTSSTNAPPARQHKAGPRGAMVEHLIPPRLEEKLNLTEDQKPKIKAIEESYTKTAQEYRTAHKAEFDAARAAREEATKSNDPAKRKEAGEKFRQAMAGLQPQRQAAVDQIKSLLTDEQKKTWEETVQELRGKHGGAKPPPAK